MTWLGDILRHIEQATKPRNPEREYGTEETVRETKTVRESGQPIKIITD